MSDNKYSAKEAAIAVLKKAEELYKASNLAKGEMKKDGPSPTASPSPASQIATGFGNATGSAGVSNAMGNLMGKSEENPDTKENPDAKEDADLGEKVEQDVEQHEKENAGAEEQEAEQKEPEMKGHLKLAKFMGRMEHKRGERAKEMDKAETGHEKGIHRAIMGVGGLSHTGNKAGPWHGSNGRPIAGSGPVDKEGAIQGHKQVLGEMKQMRKPNLGKAESAFDKVKNKIKEKEGYSEKAAAATAAKIGRNELGEAEMARRSAAGRKK
jgi:hypothetical protein